MTCIVGFVDKKLKETLIGGDSAGVGGWDVRTRVDEKVFRVGPFLMGFTSSFRMGQLLRYDLQIPEGWEDPGDDYRFMVSKFVPAVRKFLFDGGFGKKENGVEEGGWFLVGFKDRLYTIQPDFQVAETIEPYTAIGCGQCYALGALEMTDGMCISDRVLEALRVAEKYSNGVRGPFHVLTLQHP